MTAGSWVLGILNGLTVGLLAVGLVLVFKSNRFLNLAGAQLGAIPALLLAKWTLDSGWNWWLAFIVAIAVGIVSGLVVERFLVRPLRAKNASAVRLLLLSLAVSQLLLALTYIPHVGPNTADNSLYPQPFNSTVHIGGVVLSGMYILTAILVPILVIALALFMRYSVLGKQIRAAASNPDAARLCGISVTRVSAVTWGLAGAFAAVSAILAAPNQASFNDASFGPYLLMLTLGAAALGAFVSLPMALVGGLLIGLVNQLVLAQTSSASDAELAVYGLIILIVLVRGRAIGQVFDLGGSVAEERPAIRVPEIIRGDAIVRYHRVALILGSLIVAAVVPQLPYFNSTGHQFLLSLILIYALLGVALTMLVGWGGQVSLGHFALVGLGAYLTARWAPHGMSLPVLLILVGLVGAVVLVIIGLPAVRMRGLTLVVTTLGFAVVADDWLFSQNWVGSNQSFGVVVTSPRLVVGLGKPASQAAVYYVALIVLTLTIAACAALRRSGPGRLIVAVRDNERASAAFGVTPATVKIAVLALSGFVAGTAGVLWADAWKAVSPSQFPADVSLALIAIPVIGGLGSLGGSVAAAVTLYGMTFFIGPHVDKVFGSFGNNIGFNLFLAGMGQALVLIFSPNGIAGEATVRWQGYLDKRAAKAEAKAGTAAADAPPPAADATERWQEDPEDQATRARIAERFHKSDVPLLVTDVNVRFGGVVALSGPDIEVRKGEIVGLIGTNGAGKTTLMNVISGLISPSSGSVQLFGQEVVDLPADLRSAFGLSRSFQDASLFSGLTVTETVQLPITQRHKVGMVSAMFAMPWVRSSEQRTRQEALAIVDRFGLSNWADARTSDLSTGTRRICDLAAQVAAKPWLLLLDEPTAGVAQREAEAFGPLLRRIRDDLDCAILIVEHDMPLLMGLCDRIYALETGTVIAEGTPDEIRVNPRVIASYLGTTDAAIDRSGALANNDTPPGETPPSRRTP
jgi:ABC-type branched-subunit amino acid transport system ATPase component/ABC-type branched-subunit amino acid transport system permease subunit